MTLKSSAIKQQIIALLQANQPAQAREFCVRAMQTTEDAQILALLATSHLRLGETDAAINAAQRAIELGWNDPGAFVMLVALLTRRGDESAAGAWFARLLVHVPREAEAHRQIARVLNQLGEAGAATGQYFQAVALDPGSFDINFELAGTLAQCGNPAEAVDWYEKCLVLRPEHVQVHCDLASCLANLKQFDRAAQILEQAQALEPDNPRVNFCLGETRQNQNLYHQAIACYERALEIVPDEIALYGSLARANRNLGDTDAALAYLHRAGALAPGNATVYHETGICLFDDTHLEPARNAFAEAVRLNPANAQSRFYLGFTEALGGKKPEAGVHFDEACRLWPYMEHFVDSFYYASKFAGTRFPATNRQMFELAIGQSPRDGLYLEFGVYHGASINIIARLTENRVYGFDTFQGLPIAWKVGDRSGQDIEPTGSYSTHGVLPAAPDNVEFVVGTFAETLPGFSRLHPEPVGFVNIDCDLYESTCAVFKYLGAQIRPGTVIVFDEYFCLPGWRDHEYKAFQEFIAESGFGYRYLAFNFFTSQVAVRITAG